jgi:tRNA nucleotidyltransferase (CCA-adding enzyme)
MIGCDQDAAWHPEGDVWNHTLHCVDAFARMRVGDEWEDLVVGFAVLSHDLGKPATTAFIDGHWRSRGHDSLGVPIAERFLRKLTAHEDFIAQVLPLVECHMRPRELFEQSASDAAIRRLARKVVRIDRLVRVARADMFGRPPMPTDFPEGDWLLEQAKRLEVADSAPAPIIMGRHLVERGYKPSVEFKAVLESAYEAQLDGAFFDLNAGQKWLEGYLKEHPIG